jgi:hypothetical protein
MTDRVHGVGELRTAGGATLANGTPATLHEFVGLANYLLAIRRSIGCSIR